MEDAMFIIPSYAQHPENTVQVEACSGGKYCLWAGLFLQCDGSVLINLREILIPFLH